MPHPTVSSRAAGARATRRRRPTGEVRDPCPVCHVELAAGGNGTQRLVLFSTVRGVFTWRCPDCKATWSEAPATQTGSTARGRSAPQPLS